MPPQHHTDEPTKDFYSYHVRSTNTECFFSEEQSPPHSIRSVNSVRSVCRHLFRPAFMPTDRYCLICHCFYPLSCKTHCWCSSCCNSKHFGMFMYFYLFTLSALYYFWFIWCAAARHTADPKETLDTYKSTHRAHMHPPTHTYTQGYPTHPATHQHAHYHTLYLLLLHTLIEKALQYELVNVLAAVPVAECSSSFESK